MSKIISLLSMSFIFVACSNPDFDGDDSTRAFSSIEADEVRNYNDAEETIHSLGDQDGLIKGVTSHCGGLVLDGVNPFSLTGDQVIDDHQGPLDVLEAETLRLINIRGPVIIRAALSVPEVDDVHGPMILNSQSVGRVNGIRGPACIGADEVDRLTDFHGPLVLLGPAEGGRISHISNIRGPIYLVNFTADRIDNHHGPVFVYNGSVGQITNSLGPLIER